MHIRAVATAHHTNTHAQCLGRSVARLHTQNTCYYVIFFICIRTYRAHTVRKTQIPNRQKEIDKEFERISLCWSHDFCHSSSVYLCLCRSNGKMAKYRHHGLLFHSVILVFVFFVCRWRWCWCWCWYCISSCSSQHLICRFCIVCIALLRFSLL